MSSTCPHNMVNFGPLTAFGAPLQISTGFVSWQRYCTASSSGREPNFASLNRGLNLCSAGRPSGWALTHILVTYVFTYQCWVPPWDGCVLCVALQPSLIGHEKHLLVQTAADDEVDIDEDDDLESELMWRAPALLSLADVPWLVDDAVEPGVTLRYIISYW